MNVLKFTVVTKEFEYMNSFSLWQPGPYSCLLGGRKRNKKDREKVIEHDQKGKNKVIEI